MPDKNKPIGALVVEMGKPARDEGDEGEDAGLDPGEQDAAERMGLSPDQAMALRDFVRICMRKDYP